MAYKIKIDNVEYDLKDNFTIKDELNETLDSATIQFNTYGQEANFESFDVAQIYDFENKITKKHFLVDSIDDEIYSFGSNFESDDHFYTVSLFSETKELERITLPNCSVTQPVSGTKKSVYQEIERFCSLYVPRIKVYDANATSHYSYQRKFTLDSALQTRFNNIDCPEFQWNNPTLREVLNDLVSTDDCIIVVKEGIISFYDLKQKGNPIDVSKLSFSKKSMSSQDYVGELTIDMQNAIGKEPSLVCEGITLRAPEGEGSLTTINGVLKTQSPIYAIKKLRIKVPIGVNHRFDDETRNYYSYDYAWIDITDRVLEKEEFDLLSNVKINTTSWENLDTFTDANGVTCKKHKVNFLYYERGGNEVFNVGTNYPYLDAPTTKQTYFADNYLPWGLNEIGNVLGLLGHHTIGPTANDYEDADIMGDADPRNLQFYIEYETVAEHAIRVGKNLPVKHPDNRIFDNQSNSYVDQEHMSIFEYAKINRLGHKIRNIAGDYFVESEIPQLGDYIGDEILFSREITYEDNILHFKGMLCPNYVLRDFFTGVRARKRSWQIAKNEDALTRHDIYKLYVETSFKEKHDIFTYADADHIKNMLDNAILPSLLPFAVENTSPYQILGCGVQTRKGLENYPSAGHCVVLDTQNAILGRSFCIDFGFNDNYKSADYIVSDGTELTQSFYAYADSNGEYDTEHITLCEVPLKTGSDSQRTETTEADLLAEIREGYTKPKLMVSDFTDNFTKDSYFVVNVQKDNREIIRHTLQFEFCSDTNDIIVTNDFLKRIIYVDRVSRGVESFKIYVSSSKYEKDDTEVKGIPLVLSKVKKTSSGQNVKVSIVGSITGNDYSIPIGVKSWAVTDLHNNLLLAVNLQSGQEVMECWFNLLRSRDTKVYSDNYNGIVIGDITDSSIANLTTRYNAVTTRASSSVSVQRRTVLRS